MNRARVQELLSLFFERAACATVADCGMAHDYLHALRAHLAQLEENYDPLDVWSVLELERVSSYLFHNKQWILGADQASVILGDAFEVVEQHRQFLFHHGLLPEHLASRPENGFKPI